MALNELGIDIPRDMSIIGIDNYSLSQIVKPRLWLAEQPLARMAEEGTRLLLERINSQGEQKEEVFHTVTLPTNIIEGESIRQI